MMAMAEYIERETAYPLAKKICDAIDSEDFQRLNFGMRILDWIDDLPAADVRPVVRNEKKILDVTCGDRTIKPRWIPVNEALPEAGKRVLCYCRANIYEVMKMRTDGDWVYDTNHVYMHSFVTHWMPLPEPPKEVKD